MAKLWGGETDKAVDNFPISGEQIPLPVTGEGDYTCPHTGQRYQLTSDGLLRV